MNFKAIGLVFALGVSLTGCSSSGSAPLGGKCPEISIALSSSDLVVDNLQASLNEGKYKLSEIEIESLTSSYELLWSLKDFVGGDEAFEPIYKVTMDQYGIIRAQENSDFIETRDSTWGYHVSSKSLRSICEE